jgi:hypothetical protein
MRLPYAAGEEAVRGSLNDILADPISGENEKVLLDLLKRKMMVTAEIAVDLLHAMEARFGHEAREVMRSMIQKQEFEPRQEVGDPEADLHEFCAMVDRVTVGTHQWERVIEKPNRVGYHLTRCMYAEIFRELGEPELGYVMCARDEPWIKSFNPKLAFKRTRELMSGHEICDNTYCVER